jgi:DNA polymerase-3 subunit gamma/tau
VSAESGASLYNRYRPTRFEDMVGQEHVARALANALTSGRPARGYLFSGPRGTGKTTTARILARCLNCQSFPGPTATPCMKCDSCLRTGHDDWLDVVEVDAASSARRIDEMRDWLETVRYAPVVARYRVTIMDEAHQIQEGAASALLKTLEEPPPHLVVILCTTHPWDILPTIRSRVQHFVLRAPGIPALVRVLDRVAQAEGIETTETALDTLARAADGSYRDALGLLDQIVAYSGGRVELAEVLELLGAVARETLFELVDLLANGDVAGAFSLLEDVLDSGSDPEQLMRGLVTQLRCVCLLQQGAGARDDWAFAPDELARLGAQANQLSPNQVVRALDLLADAQVRIRNGGADPRLQLELVAAKLARPALDADAAGIIPRIEVLERGTTRTLGIAPAQSSPSPVAAAPAAPPLPPQPAADPGPPEDALSPAPEPVLAPDPAYSGPPAEQNPGDNAPAQRLAPEAPVPAPTPPAPRAHTPAIFDLAHVERMWPQVLSELRSSHPPLYTFIEDGRPTAAGDGVLVMSLPSSVGASMLGKPDQRIEFEMVLLNVFGQRIHVDIVVSAAPAPASPAEPAKPATLDTLRQELIATFDATEEPH